MSGTLEGSRYTIRGRTMLSTESEGETYYWNEFNLQDDSGRYATLVFEESEDDSPWKLFTPFDPRHPLDRDQAASIRVGDMVSIDGKNAHVSLVGQSRVVFNEGTVADGVELGDVANYFNADYADKIIVVSWSGVEVEHFEGRSVPHRAVARAFNLGRTSAIAPFVSAPKTFWSDRFMQITAVVVVLAIGVLGWLGYKYFSENRAASSNKLQVAAPSRLALGQRVSLAGKTYSMGAHALIHVGQPGQRFERHEYALIDTFDDGGLLVNGLDGNLQHWHLLKIIPAPPDLTPVSAAKFKSTQQVQVGGRLVRVAQVFQTRVVSSEGSSRAELWPDAVQYGFVGRSAEDWIVARWSDKGLQLFQGKPVDAAEVASALAAPTSKPK